MYYYLTNKIIYFTLIKIELTINEAQNEDTLPYRLSTRKTAKL